MKSTNMLSENILDSNKNEYIRQRSPKRWVVFFFCTISVVKKNKIIKSRWDFFTAMIF